jgi:cell division septation protein DedD
MTVLRPLPRSRLDGLVPPLVQAHTLVALVAATSDAAWAAAAAWDVARAAAATGRRTALVDLGIEAPSLHAAAALPAAGPGIVDAFEQGAELTSVAREVDRIHFLPAGARTAAPEFVLAHPRWNKLHAGFRAADALLLVYLGAGALGRLSALPDAVLVLAPEGCDVDSPLLRDVMAAQVDGAALLGVVRERWSAPQPAIPDAAPRRRRRSRAAALAAAGVLVVVAALGARAVTARRSEARAADAPPAAPAPAPRARPDTLGWAIQLAAYTSAANALAHADELAGAGLEAVVAPVAPAGSGAVWYRVLAGAYLGVTAAEAARESLWARGIAPRGAGDMVRAPLVLRLERASDRDSLRARGVPAVRRGDDLVVGAFESPDQAAYAQDQLIRAGVPAVLVPRLERRP